MHQQFHCSGLWFSNVGPRPHLKKTRRQLCRVEPVLCHNAKVVAGKSPIFLESNKKQINGLTSIWFGAVTRWRKMRKEGHTSPKHHNFRRAETQPGHLLQFKPSLMQVSLQNHGFTMMEKQYIIFPTKITMTHIYIHWLYCLYMLLVIRRLHSDIFWLW